MHHERERQKTENESRKPMFEKPKYERHIKFFNSAGNFFLTKPPDVSTAWKTWLFPSRESFKIVQTLGSRRWNWKFRNKAWENQDPNFCYIQVIVFDLKAIYQWQSNFIFFTFFFMVAYLLSPNRCQW